MVTTAAVSVVATCHMVFRVSFFIEQNIALCSLAPTLASWIFLLGLLDVLWDIRIFPASYMHLPVLCQIVVEIIMATIAVEFGMFILWCNIERMCCKLTKFSLLRMGLRPEIYDHWQTYILGITTTTISLVFLFCVNQATDHAFLLRKRAKRLICQIKQHFRSWVRVIARKCPLKFVSNRVSKKKNKCRYNNYDYEDDFASDNSESDDEDDFWCNCKSCKSI